MVKRALLALGLALLGCGSDPITQVIVVVDSDIADLEQIRLDVVAPDGRTETATAALGAGEPGLPRTLTLVHSTGPLGPYQVTATGLRGGGPVVDRRASFDFQADRSLVLTMHLVAACQGQSCGGQTCTERGCESLDSNGRLTAWTGTPPRLGETPMVDMGTPEVDMCRPEVCNDADDDCDGAVDEEVTVSDEACNGDDDDCDGTTDEDFDLQNDPMNCGGCGIQCVFRNGSGTCTGGSCVIASCDAGFEDCDGDGTNGCEIDTSSNASNCGGCGNVCRNPDRICCTGSCQRSCP
ncbi:MAG: hypothetical protein CMN30_11855 [Sandaracinus sp.]|nr:hypothetical protein [Sandaracinus sp.]|tara:strand:- start:2403 stop:3287 length:885 start_codon:yes stop_codon:yes gene_type:complete